MFFKNTFNCADKCLLLLENAIEDALDPRGQVSHFQNAKEWPGIVPGLCRTNTVCGAGMSIWI